MVTRINTQNVRDESLTHEDVSVANKDGLAATPSFRTLGIGAQQACATNDPRLSDARVPLAHHTTHEAGGSDPIPGLIVTPGDGNILLNRIQAPNHAQSIQILTQTFNEDIELVVDYKIQNRAGTSTNYYLIIQKGSEVAVPAYSNVGLSMIWVASGGISAFSPPLTYGKNYLFLNKASVSDQTTVSGTIKLFYGYAYPERPVIQICDSQQTVGYPAANASALTGAVSHIVSPNNFTGLRVEAANAGGVGQNSVFSVYKRRKTA